MTGQPVGVAGAAAGAPSPSVTELLAVAAEVAGLVNERSSYVTVSSVSGAVCVWVECQADAEHLSRLLRLGRVSDYPASETSEGFTVWAGGSWPNVQISVYCSLAGQVRPVRAFPVRAGDLDQLDVPVPYQLTEAA